MPYATASLYATWHHTINGTDEVAQTGLHISGTGFDDADAIAAASALTTPQLTELADAWLEVWSESLFRCANYGRFVGVRVAPVGVGGLELADARELDVTPVAGPSSGAIPQASTVLSLRSGSSFGRANYGRMYVPYSSPELAATTPYITASNVPFLADAAKAFLDRVNVVATALGAGLGVSILSPIGPGTTKSVLQVGVDRVVDTQRRRSRQLEHVYTFSTLDG